MNLYNFVLLSGIAFSIAMAIIVYRKNKRNEVNIVFAILSILVAFCVFTNFLISVCENKNDVYPLLKFTSFRLLLFPVTVQFFLLLTGRKHLFRHWWMYALLYSFPAFIILYPENTRELFSLSYLGEFLGWNFFPNPRHIIIQLISGWVLIFIVLIHYLAIANIRRARDYFARLQAIYILIGFMVSLLLPVLFDIIFPLFNMQFPQTASGSIMLGFILIGYTIIKYDLFAATPESAAENILRNVSDSVILTHKFGTITFANASALKLTGFSQDEITGKSINELFSAQVLDEFYTYETGNINIELLKKNGEKIPVMISHSIMYARKNQISGHVFIIREITELKNLIDQLTESEIRFKNIFENIQSVYFEFKPDGTITEVSPSIEAYTYFSPKELLGKNISILFADTEKKNTFLDQIYREKRVRDFEMEYLDKNKNLHYCLVNAIGKFEDELPVKIIGSLTNIDELKKAERFILESEKKYRLVTENSSDFVAQMKEDGTFVYISPSFRIFGFTPEAIEGTRGKEIIHPEDFPGLEEIIRETRVTEKPFIKEFRLKHPDGHYTWIEARCNWITDNNQKYLICNAHDISVRKSYEEKLIVSEEKFRILFEKSPDGIVLVKDLFTPLSANDAVLSIFGYDTFEEFAKIPFIAHALPDQQIKIIEYERLRKAGIEVKNSFEVKIRRKDGQIRHAEFLVHELVLQNQPMQQFIIRDITDKVLAEQRLIESEMKYSLLVENSPDDIFLLDEDMNFIMVNIQAARSLGCKPEDIIGKSMFDLFPRHIAERQSAMVKRVFQTGKMSENMKALTYTSKGERWYNTVLVPVKNNQNKVISVMGIGRDITEIEEAEIRIRKNEEMYRIFLENFQGIALRMKVNNQLEFLYGDIQNITGYTREELFSGIPSMRQILHPDDRLEVLKSLRQLRSGTLIKKTLECRIFNRNRQIKYLRVFLQTLFDENHKPAYIQAALIDKTDIYELQNKIISAIVETEDNERARFAEDLHDELGPLLSSIRIYLNLIQTKTTPEKEKERTELIEFTKQLIDDAVQQTRNISYNIMPEILGQYGMLASIKSFCGKISKNNNIRMEIFTENFRDEERFDSKVEVAIYRVIKELVNNTLKHAEADKITIRFSKTNNDNLIEYADNGKGFDFQEKINAGNTLGLRNIFHRIQSVNGTVQYFTAPAQGTRVIIRW